MVIKGFTNSSVDKESVCNARDPGWIPGLGRSIGEWIDYPLQYSWASLVAQLKESTSNVGDLGSIPGLGIFLPREFHGQYSPWVCKKLDMAVGLSLSW